MTYYPKNKIQQNLQTNGDEYKTVINYNNDGPFYVGLYYKLYNGKYYTGKFPGDGDNKELIPIMIENVIIPIPALVTSHIPPLFPTPKDYEVGVFTRYFSKKRNEFIFNEFTKDQYSNINTTLYIKFQIQWQLVGDKDITFNTNRNIVLLAEQKNKVPGLSTYLKENYLQYYK